MDNSTVLQNCLLSTFYNRITFQLDDTNYVNWRFMLESMLVGCDLMGYIYGSVPCPSQYKVTQEAGVSNELTQEYEVWRKHDAAIMALIAGTLSSSALSLIVGSKTSKEVWYVLEERYAKLSKFKAFELQNSMQKIQKGNDSIDKYMERLKTVRDKLSLAGVYISDEDMVNLILNGLPVGYLTFKIVIRASKTPITLTQLRTLLLDFESDIIQESSFLVSAPLTTSEENQSPGTHFSTQFAYVPQHTSHVSSACTMNPSYAANTMVQNGYFGSPLMSSNGHMGTFVPHASVGSIGYPLGLNASVGSILYHVGPNVVSRSDALYNSGLSQPSAGNVQQNETHLSTCFAQQAGYLNPIVGAHKCFNHRSRAKACYQSNGQNYYENHNNACTYVRTSSLHDTSCGSGNKKFGGPNYYGFSNGISNTRGACQICNNKGHTADVCSQRSSPRQVVVFGYSLKCQICFKRGHNAAECFHRHRNVSKPPAYAFPQRMATSFFSQPKAVSFATQPSHCISHSSWLE